MALGVLAARVDSDQPSVETLPSGTPEPGRDQGQEFSR